MSKKQKRQVLKEQKLNTILLESYETKAETISGSPVIGSFEVAITESNALNANGRTYPSEVWNQPDSFAKGGKYLDENGKLRPLSLMGYTDHPHDNQLEVLLEKAAITWSELNLHENTWTGKAHILNTPNGKIVKTFLDYAKAFGGGDQIGVSTRADGTTSIVESAGEVYEQVDAEGFYLAAIDFVYNPSSFVANSPKLLENKKRQRTLLENIQSLAKEDEEHKQVYIDFINQLKLDLSEAASLDRAKQAYLKDLKEQEYKLHQAIYEIENMSDNDFRQANISDTLTQSEFLLKIKKEHRKLVNEIDKEEGLLETMTKEKENQIEQVDETKATEIITETELEKEVIVETEIETEDNNEEVLTEAETGDNDEDDNADDNDNADENEVEEEQDENEDDEVEDNEEEDEVEDEPAEITLEALDQKLNDLLSKIDYITDWLFEIEDPETKAELELELDIEPEADLDVDLDNLEDDEFGITDDEFDLLSDEELEALYNLADDEE